MTLRQLFEMCDARDYANWSYVAYAVTVYAEANRDKKKRSEPYRVADFHPHEQERKKQDIPKVPITVLRDLFVPKKKK